MRLSSLFSSQPKNLIARARAFVSFAHIIRWGLVAIFLATLGALVLDVFIFYLYSYRVVNLKPEPVVRNIIINREKLAEALKVLDNRTEQFNKLYENNALTPP